MNNHKLFYTVFGLLLVLGLVFGSGLASPGATDGLVDDTYADLVIGVPGRAVGPAIEAGGASVLYGYAGGLGMDNSQWFDQFNAGGGETPDSHDAFGRTLAGGDFDGDGRIDLAIGVPGEAISGEPNAGAVHILFGAADSFSAVGAQLWSHAVLDGQNPEAEDRFGAALASGDFNLDGFDDLAVGIPGQDFGFEDIGMVNVLYGSPEGLAGEGYIVLVQGLAGLQDSPEENDQFGRVLSTGDFNGDAYHDLVVGVPWENIDTTVDAGAVHVIYGSSAGLTSDGNEFWYQGLGIQDAPEQWDDFGTTLASGDFDGNGCDDLAIGVPNEDYQRVNDGVVHILWGEWFGLSDEVDQMWAQDFLPPETSEVGDRFGAALASGDFDHDGHFDLAIGVPDETLEEVPTAISMAGILHVLYGPNFATGSDIFQQDDPETGDQFAYTLAAGDFGGGSWDDLAIGVPYEDSDGGLEDTGVVHIFYGTEGGLSPALDQTWDLNYASGMAPEEGDHFGLALVVLSGPHTELQRLYLPLLIKE